MARNSSHPKAKRDIPVKIYLSEEELNVIEQFQKKTKQPSLAAAVRESSIRFIMGHLIENNYPSLFDQPPTDEG
ncbi:MAG: hypothetical protein MJZ27_01545 [Bacteroidales bacterium]|nr:hypothetical protein [Bacteroidales bacterium]